MADKTKPAIVSREIEITTGPEKEKAKKEKFPPIQIFWAFIVPWWIIHFWKFQSKKSYGWTNKLWRDKEKIYFLLFSAGFATCWIIWHFFLSLIFQGAPNPVLLFWIVLIFSNLVLNPPSSRWCRPSFEKFMTVPQRRLKLVEAPDSMGIGYPLGWHPEAGWIFYDFRTTNSPSEHHPRHLIGFGAYGYGQYAFALNAIRGAFERLRKPVILILDSDAGGLDFAELKDIRGIVVYDKQSECEKVIWYVAQEIKRRRKYLDKSAPNIVIVADMWMAAAFIGKNPDLNFLKGAIEDIVEEGNQFGVNLVLFPPAQFYMAAVDPNLRMHFDRAQFFTRAKMKVKQKSGDFVETNVESPHAFMDLFLWDIHGQPHECKGLVPTLEQALYRIRLITSSYPADATALWNKFALFDFQDFPPMPLRQEKEPKLDPKVKRWIEWRLRTQGSTPYVGPGQEEFIPQPNGETANG